MTVYLTRARFWLIVILYFIGGLGWGYIFGHYTGYEEGKLDANVRWLEAVKNFMEIPLPPCNCDPMPTIPPKSDTVVTYERLQEVS